MEDNITRLSGGCACERNFYTIELPFQAASRASIFFDDSLQSRRQQASPLAVWLRIPLEYFNSTTIAQFPDETHSSIRRTFNSRPSHSAVASIRRQFCGYCGTHLTAIDETQSADTTMIDITLGSLFEESMQELQNLDITPYGLEEDDQKGDTLVKGENVDEESHVPEEGLVKGGNINTESHVPEPGLVKGGGVQSEVHIRPPALQEQGNELQASTHNLRSYFRYRGMPYFEERIQNSSLGRMKRQVGGSVSRDGRSSVQWEIIEYEADQDMPDALAQSHTSKRIKLDC